MIVRGFTTDGTAEKLTPFPCGPGGAGTDTDDQQAVEVPFDNTGTGLTATDVQAALEELAAQIAACCDTSSGSEGGGASEWMLIAHVQKSGGANGGTSAAIDTTGADLIVIHVAQGEGIASPAVVSDSEGNTYTALTAITEGAVAGGLRSRLYFCASPVTDANHTFSVTGTNIFPTFGVQAWSGAHASPFDVENGHEDSGASLTTNPVTPSQANSLIVCGLNSHDNAATVSIDSGFTISDQAAFGGGDHYCGAMAYLSGAPASAFDPAFTANNTQKCATIAVFKPAS